MNFSEPDLPYITADRNKFRQIVLNLFNNAVKFTPHGGMIILTAKTISGWRLRFKNISIWKEIYHGKQPKNISC